jgi:hypothetical protein
MVILCILVTILVNYLVFFSLRSDKHTYQNQINVGGFVYLIYAFAQEVKIISRDTP